MQKYALKRAKTPPRKRFQDVFSGVIHVFAIEIQDVVKHLLGLHSRTLWVQLNGLDVAVDGFVPQALPAVFVALLVPLLC